MELILRTDGCGQAPWTGAALIHGCLFGSDVAGVAAEEGTHLQQTVQLRSAQGATDAPFQQP
jgi:hypothetical protein